MRAPAVLAVFLLTAGAAGGCADGPGAEGPTVEEPAVEGPGAEGAGAASGTAFVSSRVTRGLDLPFAEAARHGDLLFLSGMVGIEPGTMELVDGGLEAEARRALENIRLTLAEAGAGLDDVLRCTVMMDDIGAWSRFNEVYVEFFGEHRPARSAFGVEGLALGAAVEIECVAALRKDEPGR